MVEQLDDNSRKVVLVSLLRAISDLKAILNAQERGALKDMSLTRNMHPRVMSIGIRLALQEHDVPMEGKAELTPAEMQAAKSRLLAEMVALVREEFVSSASAAAAAYAPAPASGDDYDDGDDYEDDFEEDTAPGGASDGYDVDNEAVDGDDDDDDYEEGEEENDDDDDNEDDFGYPDDDDEDEDDDEDDEDISKEERLMNLARTVNQQKAALQQKMDFVKEQLAMLQNLKASCQSKLSELQMGRDVENVSEDDNSNDEDGEDYLDREDVQ